VTLNLKNVMRVTRFGVAWIPYIGGFVWGICLGFNNPEWIKIIFATICILSFTGLGHIVNFWADQKVDAINTQKKDIDLRLNPFVTADVTVKEGIFLVIIFTALTVVSAMLTTYTVAFYLLITSFIGCVGYSIFYWKGKPVMDIISIPVVTFMFPFLSGYMLSGGEGFPLYPLLCGILVAIITYIPTVTVDYEFDKKTDVNTSAVYFGKEMMFLLRKFLAVMQIWLTVTVVILSLVGAKESIFLLILMCYTIYNHQDEPPISKVAKSYAACFIAIIILCIGGILI